MISNHDSGYLLTSKNRGQNIKLHSWPCDMFFHGFSCILNSNLHSITMSFNHDNLQTLRFDGGLMEVNCRLCMLYQICVNFHKCDSDDFYAWKLNGFKEICANKHNIDLQKSKTKWRSEPQLKVLECDMSFHRFSCIWNSIIHSISMQFWFKWLL